MRLASLTLLSAVIIASCGGGSRTASNNPPTSFVNNAPSVGAGRDQNVNSRAEVTLTGSASDSDGDSLTYGWVQTAGTIVTLSNASMIEASFEAPDVSSTEVLQFQFQATDSRGASTSDEMLVTVSPTPQSSDCVPGVVPQTLRGAPYMLDNFYQKYCGAIGIPVLGSSLVRNAALVAAHDRMKGMTSKLDTEIIDAMINLNTRVGIMAQSEVTTDIPEHSNLNTVFPDTDWDARARGLGAIPSRPASTGAEENLLCLLGDVYAGQDIFVHEFAHTIHIMGIAQFDPNFEQRLERTFTNARNAGLWNDTYAGTNELEYWAEGVQSWFNVNEGVRAGVTNHVNTRAELRDYDLALHDLIAEYFPTDYQPACP